MFVLDSFELTEYDACGPFVRKTRDEVIKGERAKEVSHTEGFDNKADAGC